VVDKKLNPANDKPFEEIKEDEFIKLV